MPPPLLQLSDIALTFGGHPLLDGVELSVSTGERVCLVGRNGSGKSTLLKIAAGLIEPDHGTRFVQPGASVRYLPQEPDFAGHATTLSYVKAGLGASDDAHQARYLLQQLGLDGDEDPAHLSGGEARRAALARVLAPAPDILLLDEPTNHLDLPTIEWLEATLAGQRGALVLISHDRRFLENLSRITVWLDRGKARRVEVGFKEFEAWRDQQLAEEEVQQHKLDRKIVREEHWVRYGVTARRKRNVRRMAELRALRQQRREHRRATGKAVIEAAEAEKSGALVIEAKGIGKAFGARKIVDNFSARIMRGDRIGVVGPNGSGKTTLVSLLIGALAPDSGEVRLGANIEMAALEQDRDSLNPSSTLAEALTGGRGDHVAVGSGHKHVVSYMKDFLFQPEQARTPLRVLSGGERGRLMLARALAKPSNLLVLDEPTNDLDLETLDVLEEMLSEYAGTVILISHDRDFLDRIVHAVIVPEGDGKWTEYVGGYSEMLAQRGADIGGKRIAKPKAEQKIIAERPAAASTAKRRLSFKDKHALETLPKQLAALQDEANKLHDALADPALYARDAKAFAEKSARLTAVQAELSAAEEKWLELEILREEIEGA
ncbi:ABC-F family ATP-binding cassette domain-containing protein [Hyphomicrobium sp.]|uniref:ABC-F family ATP-binding cassette domain-containing protein n=1 Tax=Hyphomicrobium sp. TaxID=82 RepID=UPI001329C096|nr:ATP-binding cassette domain-containing protein [Hyphomicrobium sp.]KAB2942327.1 MAG: ATP-binding cassette domain-containing protein [Hyphomicrobium sp.]